MNDKAVSLFVLTVVMAIPSVFSEAWFRASVILLLAVIAITVSDLMLRAETKP